MNFGFIIRPVLRALFPRAPEWVTLLLLDLVPELVETVREVLEDRKLKTADAIKRVRDIVDDAFDALPEWGAATESRRDRILDGLSELALWIYEVSDRNGDVTPGDVRRTAARLRRHVRREVA